jgi:hypothetical protein
LATNMASTWPKLASTSLSMASDGHNLPHMAATWPKLDPHGPNTNMAPTPSQLGRRWPQQARTWPILGPRWARPHLGTSWL